MSKTDKTIYLYIRDESNKWCVDIDDVITFAKNWKDELDNYYYDNYHTYASLVELEMLFKAIRIEFDLETEVGSFKAIDELILKMKKLNLEEERCEK